MRRKPPDHLTQDSRKWFRSVVADFELEDHHIKLLTLACEALDRGAEARAMILAEGSYTTDRFGQRKQHPAVDVERDSRIAFARLLRELALDVNAPGESRPGQIRR